MGHTNQTANYNLPQFVGTDKPSWLGDINDAFAAIDTAIAAAASEASTADGKADALGTTVSGHTTQIGTLQNTVTTQGNTLNTVTSLIGNGTPTTTDQTIIGAINELHADQGDLTDLQTTAKSSLVAAINEVAQGGGTPESVEVTADGTKTYSQLMDDLFALITYSKLNQKSVLVRDTGTVRIPYIVSALSTTSYSFCKVSATTTKLEIGTIAIKSTASEYFNVDANVGAATSYENNASQVPTSGVKFTLYY